MLFSKADQRLIWYPMTSKASSYTIPQGIREIGADAFYYCKSLTSVTISDSVTSIGERAFSWCKSLTSVTIPDSVTSIGKSAFSSCSESLQITVTRDSYAEQYCKDNQLNYIYTDSLDWLLN